VGGSGYFLDTGGNWISRNRNNPDIMKCEKKESVKPVKNRIFLYDILDMED
jgi:hypothetical protein